MTNIKTQTDKCNIAVNQTELLPTEKKNVQHEVYTCKQWAYVNEHLETARRIYTTSTLFGYEASSLQEIDYGYYYTLISLPNEDVALIKVTPNQEDDYHYSSCDSAYLISYMTNVSPEDLKAAGKILHNHETEVAWQEHHITLQRMDLEVQGQIKCLEKQITSQLQEQLLQR